MCNPFRLLVAGDGNSTELCQLCKVGVFLAFDRDNFHLFAVNGAANVLTLALEDKLQILVLFESIFGSLEPEEILDSLVFNALDLLILFEELCSILFFELVFGIGNSNELCSVSSENALDFVSYMKFS